MAELFSQVLGLQEKDVFLETAVNDTTYFSITGLPPIMSYGKHPFTITFNDPTQGPLLKNLSNIIFEFVDSRGSVIFSNLMDIEELSGAGNGFVWIKKNLKRTASEVAESNIKSPSGTICKSASAPASSTVFKFVAPSAFTSIWK